MGLEEDILRRRINVHQLEVQQWRWAIVGHNIRSWSFLCVILSVLSGILFSSIPVLFHWNIMAGERFLTIFSTAVVCLLIAGILHWLSGSLGIVAFLFLAPWFWVWHIAGSDSTWARASTAPHIVEYYKKHVDNMKYVKLGIPFKDKGVYTQAEFIKKDWKKTWMDQGGAYVYRKWSGNTNLQQLGPSDLGERFEKQWTYFIKKIKETDSVPEPKDAPVWIYGGTESRYKWYEDAPGNISATSYGNWVYGP